METLSHQEKIYWSRVNKAIDYIEANLDKPFSLDELARVATFSKFHFTRLFAALVGETPFQFVMRVRLERAATLLISAKDESISRIAFQCGFTDVSIFSRNFKSHFQKSASDYRKLKIENSNISQTQGKHQQNEDRAFMYFSQRTNSIKWKTKMKLNESVEVKTLPKLKVAYIRHIGPYQGNEKLFEGLWNRLFAWAGPRGLIGGPNFKSLIMYHDDPNVTEQQKLRLSVCISVPEDTVVDGEIGKMDVEGGTYVVARFKVDASQFAEAWQWVYGTWLPNSGYQPDDKPCFEVYPEEPKDGKFTVDICVPVKPL